MPQAEGWGKGVVGLFDGAGDWECTPAKGSYWRGKLYSRSLYSCSPSTFDLRDLLLLQVV
jgi:hypothetical protein